MDRDGSLEDALAVLTAADTLVGHNIIKFDIPALKLLLDWEPSETTVIRDTLVLSAMATLHWLTRISG